MVSFNEGEIGVRSIPLEKLDRKPESLVFRRNQISKLNKAKIYSNQKLIKTDLKKGTNLKFNKNLIKPLLKKLLNLRFSRN